MKLIDVDALIDALNSKDLADWLSEQDEYTPASIVEHALETLPIVDAVPVEWIENYLRNYRYMAPIEKNFVREMIKAWAERKEE